MKLLRKSLPLLVLGIGIAIASYIVSSKPPAKRRPMPANELTVEVMALHSQPFTATIATQGVVEPRTTTTLLPRVSGEILTISANFRPGGFFEKGDTLLRIDQRDYQLEIKTAQASLAEAQFNFEQERALAEQAAENWDRLGRSQAPSDLVLHKPQLARAQAAVDSARAKLQRVELDLARTQIKAPYDGRILEQYVDVGQYVTPGTQLAKLFAIDYVEIRLPISEKQRGMLDLPRLYSDQTQPQGEWPAATIHATIGGQQYSWQGRVVRSEGSVDKATRQLFVVVQIDRPYRSNQDQRPPLEIGQFVTAEIQGKTLPEVFVLPRSAVQGNGTVMVVDDENRLQRKQLDLLWETADSLLVEDGLSVGERLSVTYIPLAADNSKVRVLQKTE